MKVFFIICGVLLVAVLGANYYISKQTQQRKLEAQAYAEAQLQEAERKKQQKMKEEKQKKLKAEIEQMPVNARDFLTKKFPNPELQDFSPQPQDVQHRKALKDLLQVWNDDVRLANRTARIALPNVVSKLQESRRKVEEIQATPCVTFAQAYLYASMDDTINGLLSFMSHQEAASSLYVEQADKNIIAFAQKIGNCQS